MNSVEQQITVLDSAERSEKVSIAEQKSLQNYPAVTASNAPAELGEAVVETSHKMLNRRKALQLIGATGAALSAVFSLRLASFWSSGKGPRSDGPWWLLAPLRPGASVGYGWKIDSLSPVREGAVVLELRRPPSFFGNVEGLIGNDAAVLSSTEAQVHICVYDDQPCGIAHTSLFDLFLMDGRTGDEPTPEELGKVVIGLAQRIHRNELQEVDWPTVKGLLGHLQTHSQRVERYGAANLLSPELASLIPQPPSEPNDSKQAQSTPSDQAVTG